MNIKLVRKSLGLTQEQASELIGVSVRRWQQWEAGTNQMHTAFVYLFQERVKTLFPNKKIDLIDNQLTESKSSERYTQREIAKDPEYLAKVTHEQKAVQKGKFTFIDLFAGIGGIRQAFEMVGGECVFSSEIDPFAKYTYYENFGVVPFGDITKIKAIDVPDHNILCGGFPCQPFSNIGKREGFNHPTQGTMFHEIVRIVEEKSPQIVFLENVPGLVSHDEGRTLKVIVRTLKEMGYKVFYHLLDAEHFGVPQRRKRFYLIAFLNNSVNFVFPQPPMTTTDIGDCLERNAMGYSVSKHLQESYLFKKDDGKPEIVDFETKGSVKTLVSTYHKIQRLTGTFVRDGETDLRLLTESECKKLMGFPENFLVPVSRTQMYRQFGNSVVIPVIHAIAEKILETIEKENALSAII